MAPHQRFSLRRFIKRAALITCVLALVEIVLIFFFMNGKKGIAPDPSEAKKDKQPALIDTLKEVDKLKADTSPYTSQAPKEKDSISANESAGYPNQETKLDTSVHAGNALPSADSIQKKKKPTLAKVHLSKAGMAKILRTVINKKRLANSRSNCVQIRKTTSSNVANAFDLAGYLKSKGYIISGRTTVGGSVTGISISVGGTCVSVTIGSL